MSSSREEILSYLAKAGIADKSVEDVVAEFNSSDALSQFIVGVDNVEEAVLAHITDYLAIHGISGLSAPAAAQDPTNTVKAGEGSSMPSTITEAQKNAIIATTQSTYAERQLMSSKATIVGPLADKPYPGTYMNNIGKLPIKGEFAKVKETLEAQYQPDVPVTTLLAKKESWFIPSDAQLEELKVLWPTRPGAKPVDPEKKSKVADPVWFGFNNDEHYNAILRELSSADSTFEVLVAPQDDTGVGADKEKAWRWNTKGFCIKRPDVGTGTDSMKEQDLTKKGLIGFLVAQTLGFIDAATPEGISAKLVMTHPRNKEASGTAATESKPALRVRGNTPEARSTVRYIKEVGNGKVKATCRSKMYYFAVRVSKDGMWSVRKQRLPLIWDDAPAFEVKPQYRAIFHASADGSAKKLTEKDLKAMEAASAAFVAQILKDQENPGEYGLQDFLSQVDDRMNKNAAKAAAQLSI